MRSWSEAMLSLEDMRTFELIDELEEIALNAAAQGKPIGRTEEYAASSTPERRAALFFAWQAARANGVHPCPF